MTSKERDNWIANNKDSQLNIERLANTLTDEEEQRVKELLEELRLITNCDSVGVICKSMKYSGRTDYTIELINSKSL